MQRSAQTECLAVFREDFPRVRTDSVPTDPMRHRASWEGRARARAVRDSGLAVWTW